MPIQPLPAVGRRGERWGWSAGERVPASLAGLHGSGEGDVFPPVCSDSREHCTPWGAVREGSRCSVTSGGTWMSCSCRKPSSGGWSADAPRAPCSTWVFLAHLRSPADPLASWLSWYKGAMGAATPTRVDAALYDCNICVTNNVCHFLVAGRGSVALCAERTRWDLCL